MSNLEKALARAAGMEEAARIADECARQLRECELESTRFGARGTVRLRQDQRDGVEQVAAAIRAAIPVQASGPHLGISQPGAPGDGGGFIALRKANVARNVEWTNGNSVALSLSFRGNELAGEVGEACNVLKKLDRERMGFVGSRATLDQLAEELADVVICADLTAMDCGVDLWDAVVAKFNATSEARGLRTRLSPPPAADTSPAGTDAGGRD